METWSWSGTSNSRAMLEPKVELTRLRPIERRWTQTSGGARTQHMQIPGTLLSNKWRCLFLIVACATTTGSEDAESRVRSRSLWKNEMHVGPAAQELRKRE
eukprot:2131926-Pleurochrysis_carterae.AAC.2